LGNQQEVANAGGGNTSGIAVNGRIRRRLFLLMAIFSQSLFSFMCSNFMTLSFLSARHDVIILVYKKSMLL